MGRKFPHSFLSSTCIGQAASRPSPAFLYPRTLPLYPCLSSLSCLLFLSMAPRSIRRRSPRPKPERRRLHFSPHHLLAHRSRRPRRAFAAPLWILHLRVVPHCHLPSPAARKPDHGCGDVHLLNEPSDRPLSIRGLQKKSTENIPLPLHLQTNLHVIDPWSSGICQIACYPLYEILFCHNLALYSRSYLNRTKCKLSRRILP